MKKLLCLFMTLAVALTAAACTPKQFEINQEAASLTVHFIDVGQGDSTLLESRGEFVLIDAGEKEYGATVTNYLKSRGVRSLKYVIATHPHSDHVGGLTKVIKSFDTENFITVETDQSTRTWLNVLEAVDEKNVNYIDAEVGAEYSFGEAQFTILAPLSDSYSGYNNYSVVTKVTFGKVSFLLTGDAEKQSEKEMIDSGADLRATVLKCGHHGSSSSSTAAFLKAVRPSYAVISCGRDNDYGHPHKETLKKLSLLSCAVYRTDELGTIVAATDGKGITFTTADGELSSSTEADTPADDSGLNADSDSDISDDDSGPDADGDAVTPSADGYIGNRNSHVFHRPACSGVATMSEKNKVPFTTREEAISQGYTPCSKCEP